MSNKYVVLDKDTIVRVPSLNGVILTDDDGVNFVNDEGVTSKLLVSDLPKDIPQENVESVFAETTLSKKIDNIKSLFNPEEVNTPRYASNYDTIKMFNDFSIIVYTLSKKIEELLKSPFPSVQRLIMLHGLRKANNKINSSVKSKLLSFDKNSVIDTLNEIFSRKHDLRSIGKNNIKDLFYHILHNNSIYVVRFYESNTIMFIGSLDDIKETGFEDFFRIDEIQFNIPPYAMDVFKGMINNTKFSSGNSFIGLDMFSVFFRDHFNKMLSSNNKEMITSYDFLLDYLADQVIELNHGNKTQPIVISETKQSKVKTKTYEKPTDYYGYVSSKILSMQSRYGKKIILKPDEIKYLVEEHGSVDIVYNIKMKAFFVTNFKEFNNLFLDNDWERLTIPVDIKEFEVKGINSLKSKLPIESREKVYIDTGYKLGKYVSSFSNKSLIQQASNLH